ncbi:hypothetical protein C8R43DRAFT_965666 [Mycena crocata]|nr:hypothetical protein C8R43DRAFT_965666 [Mycena crocata]
MRLKHAGRGHDPNGVWATRNGELACLCWACPLDGINLPEGWQEIAPEFQFLYMLLLVMDTNFHMKSWLCVNKREDLPLGSGWGNLVEEEPYKEHLRGYVAEKDYFYCLCGAFTEGHTDDYRIEMFWSGGVVCTRHKVVCPEGMGDLQKGERWILEKTKMLYGLPVWHVAAHVTKCQVQNLLSYQVGVGRTDGEGIERTWLTLNLLSWATKEMGAGARHEAIKDKLNHMNFQRNITQGTTLPRKLVLAIDERDHQIAAFGDVDKQQPDETREKWQKKVDDWVRDPNKPNPYKMEDTEGGGPTEAAIRLALTQDEAKDTAAGGKKLHGSSVTSFMVAGLQLKGSQRCIHNKLKGQTLLVSDQKQRVQEMRIAFFTKLQAFRRLQEIYMPGAVHELQVEEDACDSEMPPPNAEDVKLFLPLGLQEEDRENRCRKGLPEMEAKLWEGQCRDVLKSVRNQLHAKRYLLTYCDTNVVGQKAATRAYTLIERVVERVETAEMAARDIQLDEEQEIDARAQQRLGNIRVTRHHRAGPSLSSKKQYFSWIWTSGGGPGEDEGSIHDSVRVEWSKALARKDRWVEEVATLHEEMKRVLRFLGWCMVWWEGKRGTANAVTLQLCSGLDTYAAKQAALHQDISQRFMKNWSTSVANAVRMAVRDDEVLEEEEVTRIGAEGTDEESGDQQLEVEDDEGGTWPTPGRCRTGLKTGQKPLAWGWLQPRTLANYPTGYSHVQRLSGTDRLVFGIRKRGKWTGQNETKEMEEVFKAWHLLGKGSHKFDGS